jgi:ABC-2 type transport system ATP-binding protein
MTPAISVRGLWKTYGSFDAVRGIDFEVAAGEVFGLLGPNGAGKTTTVEILEGLRARTSGDVRVLDCDPATQVRAIKERIGVALQATNLPDRLTVAEALRLFSSFYAKTVPIATVLHRLQLGAKRDAPWSELSGGQRQRLALAMAMVNDPQLLFLDEPTTGLDAQVRHEIHALIDELRSNGRTVVLTTHYIEEAERLCDRIAIIDHGRIIATGTPAEMLARSAGRSHITIRLEQPLPDDAVTDVPVIVSSDRLCLHAASAQPTRTLVLLVRWIDTLRLTVADIQMKRPTLEDVYIELTGKRLRE